MKNRIFLFIFLLLMGFTACDRSEINYDQKELAESLYGPPVDVSIASMLSAKAGDSMKFMLTDMLDRTKPDVPVTWYWLNDTVMGGNTYHQLWMPEPQLDIILPEIIQLGIQDTRLVRYWKNYNYPVFDYAQLLKSDTNIYSQHGVHPHRYNYYWKSPLQLDTINTVPVLIARCGIDSNEVNADYIKGVAFTFTSGIGITEVKYTYGHYFPNNHRFKYFVLKRIF